MTFDLYQKQEGSCSHHNTYIYCIWNLSKLPTLRYCVNKIFRLWPLVTPDDLWPPPKTIGIIYSIWAIYLPSMRSLGVTLLEISCLQGFDRLTCCDPKWPLTSTKNNRDHLLNMGNLPAKYEIPCSYHSWDIMFASKASHTHTHTHTRHPHRIDSFGLLQGIKNIKLPHPSNNRNQSLSQNEL